MNLFLFFLSMFISYTGIGSIKLHVVTSTLFSMYPHLCPKKHLHFNPNLEGITLARTQYTTVDYLCYNSRYRDGV